MKANLYKIDCITNLHVGSGDVNYNIIDNEVEKDAVTGYPVIHSTGIKGALRDAFSKGKEEEKRIFGDVGKDGTSNGGAYKFFDARMLARPLRVGKNKTRSFVPVTTVAAINDFLQTAAQFGCNTFGIEKLPEIDFGGKLFLASDEGIKNIEGSDNVGILGNELKDKLSLILGKEFAIAKDINDYSLPVIARNKLEDGTSKNLWYEEFVSHHSSFWFIILTETDEKPEDALGFDSIIQIGGNASVGYGYCKISALNGGENK